VRLCAFRTRLRCFVFPILFLLWQSTHAEFYFCDTYWPSFRKIDFLRALRSYDQRQRRFDL